MPDSKAPLFLPIKVLTTQLTPKPEPQPVSAQDSKPGGKTPEAQLRGPWAAPKFTNLTFTMALIQGCIAPTLQGAEHAAPGNLLYLSSIERVSKSKGMETGLLLPRATLAKSY